MAKSYSYFVACESFDDSSFEQKTLVNESVFDRRKYILKQLSIRKIYNFECDGKKCENQVEDKTKSLRTTLTKINYFDYEINAELESVCTEEIQTEDQINSDEKENHPKKPFVKTDLIENVPFTFLFKGFDPVGETNVCKKLKKKKSRRPKKNKTNKRDEETDDYDLSKLFEQHLKFYQYLEERSKNKK